MERVALKCDTGDRFFLIGAECPYCKSFCYMRLLLPDALEISDADTQCRHFFEMRPSKNEAIFKSDLDLVVPTRHG